MATAETATADTVTTTVDKSVQEAAEKKEEAIFINDNKIYNISSWYKENESSFVPPICNKLMFGGQLKIMFVGGPNTRKDFHIDCGDEFFFQMRGNMKLPIYEKGKRKLISINQGNIFLLPGRIPHSPQRPEKNSLGLVIERTRYKELNEFDAMRWYKEKDNKPTDDPLFERWFFCTNLGKDLVPIVEEYKKSNEFKTGECTDTSLSKNPPVKLDTETEVIEPFSIKEYIKNNSDKLKNEKRITVLSTEQTKVNIMTGVFVLVLLCFDFLFGLFFFFLFFVV